MDISIIAHSTPEALAALLKIKQAEIDALPPCRAPIFCTNGDGKLADIWNDDAPLCGRCYLELIGAL